jgi:alkylresorcinol/alkylpyrone synthase
MPVYARQMASISSVALAFPEYAYSQQEITKALVTSMKCSPREGEVLERMHLSSSVERRSLALPLEAYGQLRDFTDANSIWIDQGLNLCEKAAKDAMQAAEISPADIDVVLFVSVTGIAAPSLDARLISRLGLRPDIKRIPIFGLGCVAGASGIARTAEMLAAAGHTTALFLSLELCSLTVQNEDRSLANFIASGLFGDGAAAIVMTSDPEKRGVQVVDSASRVYPDSEDVLGWDIGSFGFRIVLAASLSELVHRHIGDEVDQLLARNNLQREDIALWIAHTGGPKVLDAIESSLGLATDALNESRNSLAERGNLSSASVLDALDRTLQSGKAKSGDWGVLMAMGPGFSSECILLRWP